MIIIHDFNLGLKHFTISEEMYQKFKRLNFEIIDISSANDYQKLNAEVFFGNRIKTNDLSNFPNLKYIHLGCVGYDKLDFKFLKSREIILTNSSGIVEKSMAEMSLAAILSFNKRLNLIHNEETCSREFFDKFYHKLKPINQLKILVYGYGLVSKEFIELTKNIFLEIDVVTRNKDNCSYYGKKINLGDELKLIYNYDYIINNLPLNEDSNEYFDYSFFSKMNNQAVYLSVGRKETTVLKDLVMMVKKRIIRGAYLDVFDNKEVFEYELYNDLNFILTPHISGWSNEYWQKQYNLLFDNLKYFENKRYNKLKNLIV